jgi:hypothetical protein
MESTELTHQRLGIEEARGLHLSKGCLADVRGRITEIKARDDETEGILEVKIWMTVHT